MPRGGRGGGRGRGRNAPTEPTFGEIGEFHLLAAYEAAAAARNASLAGRSAPPSAAAVSSDVKDSENILHADVMAWLEKNVPHSKPPASTNTEVSNRAQCDLRAVAHDDANTPHPGCCGETND